MSFRICDELLIDGTSWRKKVNPFRVPFGVYGQTVIRNAVVLP